MRRQIFFAYGALAHLAFLPIYAWLAAFVGNFIVPWTIDSPASPANSQSLGWATMFDIALIAMFGLQHSIMARPSFKAVWTKIVPVPIERSTYVWASNIVTAVLMLQWRAVDVNVWNVTTPELRLVLWAVFAAGWLMVPAVSLLINHFDLFGSRQVYLYLKDLENKPLPFRTPSLYSRMRHPLYVGWIIAFWATPTMTLGHLLFATGMTSYILIAIVFEERNLITQFGPQYEEYRRQVPMFVPWRTGRRADSNSQPVPTRVTVSDRL